MLSELNKNIKKWHKREVKIAKKDGKNVGNPNGVFFPNVVKRNNFYASHNYNLIQKYTKVI